MHLASLMNLAGPDLFVVLLILLVLFGAKRLPELARGMGQAMNEFHKAKNEFGSELQRAGTQPPPASGPQIQNTPVAQQPTAKAPDAAA